MSSRLDRLFLLLENGSTTLIRKSAAIQLGEVQKLYPYKLNDLLFRILKYLQHNEWDTRIAASQAVAAILKNIPKQQFATTDIANFNSKLLLESHIKLSKFDIGNILEKNIYLLSSQGSEYDSEDFAGSTEAAAIENQKLILKKKLSFHPAVDVHLDNNFVNDEDFVQEKNPENYKNVDALKDYIFNNFLSSFNLSSIAAINSATSMKDSDCFIEPLTKLRKVDTEANIGENSDSFQEWPLTNFCNTLAVNLLDASWQKRHGAAIGLREIIKLHGSKAAKSSYMTAQEMQVANQIWLQDICVELLCVLTLDRFADFVSDEMVAPVRESCGQVLGAVMRNMHDDTLPHIVHIIKQMLQQQQWQVRHGALIALKYLIAVKQDNVEQVLSVVLSEILVAIRDAEDDVRSVAATCLIPAAGYLVTRQDIGDLIDVLWNALRSTDELTASSNNVMLLLSQLLSSPRLEYHSDKLNEVIALLWPFIDHNIMSVRRAVVITFQSLICMNMTNKDKLYAWLLPILAEFMSRLFQRCLIETNISIIEEITKIWTDILSLVEIEKLILLLAPYFPAWLCSLINSNQEEYFKMLNGIKCDVNNTNSDSEDTQIANYNKVVACRFLGALCRSVSLYDERVNSIGMEHTISMCHMMDAHMATKSAIQRLTIANVVQEWTAQTVATNKCLIPDFLHRRFIECLNDMLYFDEVAPKCTSLFADCRKFVSLLTTMKVQVDATYLNSNAWTLCQIENLVTKEYTDNIRDNLKLQQEPDEMVASIRASLKDTNNSLQLLTNRVQCAISQCLITLNLLPEKLNPIIRPLMDSVQLEDNLYLQKRSAFNVSQIIFLCKNREPCPTDKILKKIIQYLYSDDTLTPVIRQDKIDGNLLEEDEIIAFSNEQMTKNFILQTKNASTNISEIKSTRVQQIGSNEVIQNVVLMSGCELNVFLPYLWNYVNKPFEDLKLFAKKKKVPTATLR